MTPRDMALALLVQALWGCNFVAAKIGLAAFPPLFLMAIRFALVAVLLVPWVRVPWGRMRGIFLFSVLLGGIHFPLVFVGMTGVDAATASIAVQLQVPFSSLLAALIYGEKLGRRGMAGMVLAFLGVVVIAEEPRMAGELGHLGLLVLGSLVFAAVNIQIKRIGSIDGFILSGWMGLMAVPQLAVLSLVLESGQSAALASAPWSGWAALAYMSVGTTIGAYGLWYPLVHRYDVNQTMPFLLTVPVFGVLSGALMLGEPVTPALLVGGVLTVAGVAVIVVRRPGLSTGSPRP